MEDGDEKLREIQKDLESQKYQFSLNQKKRFEKKEEQKKVRVSINTKKKTILFKSKKLGKYKLNFEQRDILLALLGMPIHSKEISEIIQQPKDVMNENFIKLMNFGLIENIATIKKKQLRGDKHLSVYWLLTDKGREISMILLEHFQE